MAKLDWAKNKRNKRYYDHDAELRKRANKQRLAEQADDILASAGQRKKTVWIPPVRSPRPKLPHKGNGSVWPAYVTRGPMTRNGVTILIFNSRAEADSMGYSWVGRSAPVEWN